MQVMDWTCTRVSMSFVFQFWCLLFMVSCNIILHCPRVYIYIYIYIYIYHFRIYIGSVVLIRLHLEPEK